jgi:Ca-activated chloride channel family protein
MNGFHLSASCLGFALALSYAGASEAAGTLSPVNAGATPMEIREHHVNVVVDNGFSRTEVSQTFYNPNADAQDAVYEFPVPKDAALSEMSIQNGDKTLHGEVVGADQAQMVYDQQKAAGAQAGLATQDGYQTFRFQLAQIPAGTEARMTFVYYEPSYVDTSVGRYLYPLQNGGTSDTGAQAFWTGNQQVTGAFSFDLDLKSAVPIDEVRVPNGPGATIQKIDGGHYTVHLESTKAALNQDVVCYYKLTDGPGRVEVVPYRAAGAETGTFMMVLTPGMDLAPIMTGRDFVYVLDVSGSMDTKLPTLVRAVEQALGKLRPEDRFRIVAFDDHAWDVTGNLQNATPDNVTSAMTAVQGLAVGGGTNLFAALSEGLTGLDADRPTGVVLVTDGVQNVGIVDPVKFDELVRTSDARIFGMLMGNSANWPLVSLMADVSGGFYVPVSNQDDILGQVLLVDGKLSHESLHGAKLTMSGVNVHETTDFDFGRAYYGEQLVVFGQYDSAGAAQVTLAGTLSGKQKQYTTSFDFPAKAEENPELERLWALQMIHGIQRKELLGLTTAQEASAAIRKLGVNYQLVTDETSMLVVSDSVFSDNGIDRNNQTRTSTEHAAQVQKSSNPATNYQVGQGSPAFSGPAPSIGGGSPSSTSSGASSSTGSSSGTFGGALDPATALSSIVLALYGLSRKRRQARA